MTAMLKTTPCLISSLTPVHMGCGEDYYPTNYVIKQGALHHFAAEGMIKALSLAERKSLAEKAMQQGADGIKALQIGIYANSDRLIAHATHSVPVSEEMEQFYQRRIGKTIQHEGGGGKVHNVLEIQRHAYNPYTQQPYIAGSGIKGAIRTALLDKLNANKSHYFDKNRAAPKRAGDDLQKKLLAYDKIEQDPLRLLKIGDAHYRHADGLNGLEICFVLNRKKRIAKKMETKGIPLKMECLPANRYQGLAFDIAFLSSMEQQIPAMSDIKQLAKICNDYYLPQLEAELRLLAKLNYADRTWLHALQDLLDGEIGTAMQRQQVFLLRLGKQAGAENKTVAGARHIKIMQGKGNAPKYQQHTTTLWLTAESEKAQHNMLPLGWVLVELPSTQLAQTAQFLTDNAQADYQRQAQARQHLETIRQQQAEKARRDAEYAEQAKQKALQAAAEEAKKASMSDTQRLIYTLEQRYQQDKAKQKIEPQGELRQQLTTAIKQAENWKVADKQALLLLAQEIVSFLGLKKNKKVKLQLKTLQ